MINHICYSLEWIEQVSKQNRKTDKILVDKAIRVLTLLVEQKKQSLILFFTN